MKAMFDWGTYNAFSTLTKARLLGIRLTEIPPGDFMRKSRGDDYFVKYAQDAKPAFTTVTAHGPYYDLKDPDGLKAHIQAIRRAELAGAEVYNVHPGKAGEDRDEAIEKTADAIKKLLSESERIVITLETTYTPRLLGSIDDIRAIMEHVDSERVGISLQLENDFIREKGIYETGNFHGADAETDVGFWRNILDRARDLFSTYVSLRFSQVTGVYLRRRIFVKKRTPLGMGYPSLDVLSKALARFIVDVFNEEGKEIHMIYTGPPETKYRDTVLLYYALVREVAEHI